jgi:hypothetical protein
MIVITEDKVRRACENARRGGRTASERANYVLGYLTADLPPELMRLVDATVDYGEAVA